MSPPCDTEAERYALGYALLFDAGPLTGLRSDQFFADAHQKIFAALEAGAKGPDGVLTWLVDNSTPLPVSGGKGGDLVRRIGGPTYLAELLLDLPETPDLDAMRLQASAAKDAILEEWRRRVLAESLEQTLCELRQGKLTAADAWQAIKTQCVSAARQ